MKKLISFLTIILFITISCTQESATIKYTIASKTADCHGAFPQKCLLIKKGDSTSWEFFYSSIEGFNYEEGYEYILEIKEEKLENPPADASSIKYKLVKEISKTQKKSEGLPF